MKKKKQKYIRPQSRDKGLMIRKVLTGDDLKKYQALCRAKEELSGHRKRVLETP